MMWDTIAEENSGDMAMEFTNCQMPHDLDSVAANNNAAAVNRRRQHHHHSIMMNSSSLHEMAVDHPLSFYDDEGDLAQLQLQQQEQQQRLCHNVFGSPSQEMRLLSPEGSPCRLQILEKPKTSKHQQDFYKNNNQHHQTIATRLQKLKQHNNGSISTPSIPSPTKSLRIYHSLSSGSMGSSSMEEDYMDLLEMEAINNSSARSPSSNAALLKVPSDLDSLFMGQIKSLLSPAQHRQIDHQSPFLDQMKTPEMRRPPVRRCLSMTDNCLPTPKTPETVLKQIQELATSPFGAKMLTTERNMSAINYCFKRPEPPSKTNSPMQIKRHRLEAEKENLDISMTMSLAALPTIQTKSSHHHPPPLRKSMSMNDAEIMSALARSESTDEPDLIGDFSKPFVLPIMEGRHRDLKSISCDTMARLLRGDFNDIVANYRIIDCRYPYEYEGGHIRNAENFYTHEQIIAEFLTQQKPAEAQENVTAADKRRNIIIFHCEFSSERGPKLSRFLRSTDRERNTNCYPTLDYPEIYLLHNGYKEFFEQHSDLCDPIAYRPMLEPAYNSEYRHFRSKSKSWNGDGGGLGGATGRLKKSRSRLML